MSHSLLWYKNAGPDRRMVIQALAFGLFPMESGRIAAWLQQAGVKTSLGKQFSHAMVTQTLDAAGQASLVSQRSYESWWLHGVHHVEILEEILANKALAGVLYDAAAAVFPTAAWYWEEYHGYVGAVNSLRLVGLSIVTGKGPEAMDWWKVIEDRPAFDSDEGLERTLAQCLVDLTDFAFVTPHGHLIPKALWQRIERNYLKTMVIEGLDVQGLAEHLVKQQRKDFRDSGRLMGLLGKLLAGSISELLDMTGNEVYMAGAGPQELSVLAAACFLAGKSDEAIGLFRRAMQGSPEPFIANPLLVFQVPLFLSAKLAPVSKLRGWAKTHATGWNTLIMSYWGAFRHLGEAKALTAYRSDMANSPPHRVLEVITHFRHNIWLGMQPGKENLQQWREEAKTLEQRKCIWHQYEVQSMICRASSLAKDQEALVRLENSFGFRASLCGLFSADREWQIRLDRLASLKLAPRAEGEAASERLIWIFEPNALMVQPWLQTRLRNGAWSVPKKVSLAKLRDRQLSCITPADSGAIQTIDWEFGSGYIDPDRTMLALVGHPLVFREGALEDPVELVAEEISLVLEEKSGRLQLSFTGDPFASDARLEQVGAQRWSIKKASDAIRKIADITGTKLEVPLEGRERLATVISALAPAVPVISGLDGSKSLARELPASDRLVVQILARTEQLSISVHVRPLGDVPPLLLPGQGRVLVHGHHDGQPVWTKRDLAGEKQAMEQFEQLCPMLADLLDDAGGAVLVDPLESLEVLSELRSARDLAVIEWPNGERYRLRHGTGMAGSRLRIASARDWFEIEGEVPVDDGKVIELRQLLAALKNNQGRFVEIAPGEFLELEQQFLRQLEQLDSLVDSSAKHLRMSPFGVLALEPLIAGAAVVCDPKVTGFRDRLADMERSEPKLPEGLQADLRPYQAEGYRWLSRLASVGAGACLADDMGLGKTIQCIAVLLKLAQNGPSLVIAPSSVCGNWVAEIRRFAPGLDPVQFGLGPRASQVEALAAGQVLIASYGLMVSEEALFAGRTWNVLVLDEAHAIRNIGTQRSRAVQNLQADFRIAATGTPLQNHLGELWNLFEFLNPGLLGGQGQFSRNFIGPIEKNQDERARRTLKNLVKPFMLRRTKSQVLSELPEKTELLLDIELDAEERAWYEALRQEAIASLERQSGTKPGEEHLMVLAQLMRLRRACCHSSLSGGPGRGDSAKLRKLGDLLEQLGENQHRALVFSQFVDYLSLIRQSLEHQGISYEYLDGSTPQKDRPAIVQRFQTGQARVFLISLQAGGVGLNLTAADYVIHMDPWWNPAVEDQASDRAYRIGQTRPVTIYRLVAKDTIEEKIVQLHQSKRDLADALLEGSDTAARLDTDQLRALISGQLE